jgi:hypothetical protein
MTTTNEYRENYDRIFRKSIPVAKEEREIPKGSLEALVKNLQETTSPEPDYSCTELDLHCPETGFTRDPEE